MEITINETGLTVIFILLFLFALYIAGFLSFLTYRIFRRIKYSEKINYSKLLKEPLMGVADMLGYIIASILRVVF